MRRSPTRLFGILILVPMLAACGAGGHDDSSEAPGATPSPSKSTLRFSAIPDQNSTETREKIAPLAAHLGEVLGVEVEYVASRDYQASVEMFKNGDVQLAWFGGLTGVQARAAVAGARAVAQGASDPEFYSYFIAHKDTGLEPSEAFPAEIASRSFTFGSESSTSGRLMPEHFIVQETGKSPAVFFSSPVGFSGSHDKTVELVESGQYEAGAVNYTVYNRRVAEGKTDPDVVRVIWTTPPYADYNWTVRPDLDQDFGAGFTDRLVAALTSIDDPSLLTALPRQRLIAADNADFEGIRQVALELGMVRE